MRVMSLMFSLRLMRESAFESLNDQGRGTKWSVGHGGGLVCWGWRALAGQRLGDLRLPDADKDRQRGWADGLRGLSRDGSFSCERRTDVNAGYDGLRELALPYE